MLTLVPRSRWNCWACRRCDLGWDAGPVGAPLEAAAACHGIPRYENNGALSGLGDGSAGNAVDFAQRRRQELAEQHPKALRPPKLLHVKTAVQEQRSSTPQAFLRRRGHRDVRRSKVDRARVEQQLPRAAVPASARLRRDVDTAEPAQRSSFAASRAAEVRAFTPVVPPRGRAAPSVLRLRGDERRVAVTRGFLRRRVAAKWGFLRRRCRLRRRGRPQPRWQETTVSRRRFARRAYRAAAYEAARTAWDAAPAARRTAAGWTLIVRLAAAAGAPDAAAGLVDEWAARDAAGFAAAGQGALAEVVLGFARAGRAADAVATFDAARPLSLIHI